MSGLTPGETERSFERITDSDLARLSEIATEDSERFFSQHLKYKAPVIGVALCQGAALHFIDGKNGVNDFDVWTFYAKGRAPQFPVRRRQVRDFGESKFGRAPGDTGFRGRRVDLLGRSIEANQDPVASIQSYLGNARTRSAAELSRKAVVMLYPASVRGTVAWPMSRAAEAKQ